MEYFSEIYLNIYSCSKFKIETKCMCTKTGHSGSNITSNITLFKMILLMWHIFNNERGDGGNLASYCNITHTKTI